METSLKTKVTVKCNYNNVSSSSLPSRPLSRSTSPSTISINSSLSLPARRPRAKVNSSVVTIRKLSSASSLSISQKTIESRAVGSRAASPSKRLVSSSAGSVGDMAAKAHLVAQPSSQSEAIQSRTTRANTYKRPLAVASPDGNLQRSRGRLPSSSVTRHHVPTTSQTVTSVTPDFWTSSLSSQLGSNGSGEKPLVHADVRSSISELTEYDYPGTIPVVSLSSPAEVTRRPIRTRGYVPSELMSSVLSPSSPLPVLSKLDADSYTYVHGTVGRTSSTRTRSDGIHHMGALDNHSLDDKRVGALAIPVPSYSPPVSALSLSSPSSVSRSAISNTADNSGESSISTSVMFSPLKVGRDIELGGLCGSEQRPSLHDLSVGDQTSGDSTLVAHGRSDHWDYVELGPQCSEHKVKAEAKSNRKIADLEITNRSLLAINASLENTKHRQAKEIRDLRRKLRDSRLSLSPGTFRVLNSSPYLSESDHDEEDEGTDNGRKGKGDVLYEKIKMMLEELIVSGEKALDTVGKTEKTRE